MTHAVHPEADARGRSGARPRRGMAVGVTVLLIAACVTFLALGTWQMQRRAWKLALIERVEQRVRAAPQEAPRTDQWAQVTAASDEYRHVEVRGRFLEAPVTRVQAVTDLGAGFWILAPFERTDGSWLIINRGFVPDGLAAAPPTPASGAVTVTGLLRISEPGGGFLRHNDPGAGRWYSRDVQAIAASLGLRGVAPYFIDADASAKAHGAPGEPIGGLTVVAFHNNHLVYALTWYALAAMSAWGVWRVRRERSQPIDAGPNP